MTSFNRPIPGTFVKNGDIVPVMGLLCSIFDPPHGRFSWNDHLPNVFDTVWSWSETSLPVAGLITRNLETTVGERGIAIGMVGTDPAHRGKGYSRALLSEVLKTAQGDHCSFAILWTREHLLDFYASVGFAEHYPEEDRKISPMNSTEGGLMDLRFSDYDDAHHPSLDVLRYTFNASAAPSGDLETVRRHVEGSRWTGVSANRGCRFGVLYRHSLDTTPFYAIIAYDGPDPTVVEFVGDDRDFAACIQWIWTHLKAVPVSYSLTSPHLKKQLSRTYMNQQTINYYTMVCRLGSSYLHTPMTTWLDRI